MTRRILVTGATGFVGRHLVPALAAGGFQIRAALRRQSGTALFGSNIETCQIGDLGQPQDWPSHLAGIDAVVHLAGIAHTGTSIGDEVYDRINRLATRDLAQAARDARIRFIFMSSVRAQSGPAAPGILSEDMPARPTDAYGRSKLAAERDISGLGGPFVILRPTLIYGIGVRGNMGALMRLARSPFPLPFGAVRNARSLLAIGNLVEAVKLCVMSEAVPGGTFLLADPEPTSLPEMISFLRRGAGRAPGLVNVPPGLLATTLRLLGRADLWARLTGDLVVSAERIRAAGYAPKVTTAEGLFALGRGSSSA